MSRNRRDGDARSAVQYRHRSERRASEPRERPRTPERQLAKFITLRHDRPTNERLRAEYVAIGNRCAMLLFNTHLGPATHDEIARRAYEVGIAVQCKTISTLLDVAPDSARALLERVREQANHSIRETTESVWDMRSSTVERHGLAGALRESGRELTEGAAIQFCFRVFGNERRQVLRLEQELFRIGREAMTNSIRHAQASELCVQLWYESEQSLRLRVSDNGRGFRVDAAGSGFGIASMRARAQQIGGKLTLASGPETGSELEVVVPSL